MSETEALLSVALIWCYWWGAIATFVLTYISSEFKYNKNTVFVAFFWIIILPWLIMPMVVGHVIEWFQKKKGKRVGK